MLGRIVAELTLVLGVGVLVRTATLGGSGLAYGYLFGTLLVLAGAFRLYLSARLRRG